MLFSLYKIISLGRWENDMGLFNKLVNKVNEEASKQQETRERLLNSVDKLKNKDDSALKSIVKDDGLFGASSSDRVVAKEILKRKKNK